MSRAHIALLAALALLLGGCSGFSLLPHPAPPPALYRLNAAADFPSNSAAPSTAVQLAVAAPRAEAALDTARIALTRGPTTVDYFADAAWTDRLPLILQARLLDSFGNAHRTIAIANDGGLVRADAVLAVDLRHFEAVYSGDAAPLWRVEITANLINQATSRVIATRGFSADMPAAANDMPAIIASADAAWRRVAHDIVDWSGAMLARPSR
jgi:cholesterol transport system auxiliary component